MASTHSSSIEGRQSAGAVVLVAYYFPPHGSAGVYRPLRFVRELTGLGWQASVVTVDGARYERYDPGLLKSIPAGVDVARVRNNDVWHRIQERRASRTDASVASGNPEAVIKLHRRHERPWRRVARDLVRRAEGLVYYPDPARFWIQPAASATIEVCRQKRADAILVTGGPWSAFLVAHQAFRSTGIPYVLDFRDSWTLTANDEFEAVRPRRAVLRDRKLLDKLFRDARAVIFRYEAEAQSYWQAYKGIRDTRKIHIIPNGYEGSVGQFQVATGDQFTILYAGTVGPYRTDTFFEALSIFQRQFPDEARKCRVVFVGEGADHVRQAVANHQLTNVVALDPVSSHEVSRMQQECHALLLLGVKPYQGYELCGSKVFSYLKAARPIIGVLPSDETKRVLDGLGVSTVANIDDPSEIVGTLRQVLQCWSDGTLETLLPDRDACREYSSARQVHALERALRGSPPDTCFVPGSVEIPDSLKGKIGSDGWLD